MPHLSLKDQQYAAFKSKLRGSGMLSVSHFEVVHGREPS